MLHNFVATSDCLNIGFKIVYLRIWDVIDK